MIMFVQSLAADDAADDDPLCFSSMHKLYRLKEQMPRRTDREAISGKTPTRSAKLWAYRDQSGKKYYHLLLDDGTEERIDHADGLTAQQSLLTMGLALDELLGSCVLMPMNELAMFDEDDGLSEDQKRRIFELLGIDGPLAPTHH
jgi:hypothetical protein